MAIMGAQGSPTAFFEQLYALVVGLGLAVAVEQVLDLDRGGIPVAFGRLPLFFAYLNIAFALSHASVRYLQLAYSDMLLGRLGRGRVLADLVLGVGHFSWLIVMSFLIGRPTAFLWAAVALLIGRPVRDGLLRITHRERLQFDKKVSLVHIVAIAILLVSIACSAFLEADTHAWIPLVGGVAASIAYGLGLYLLAFDFFFPDKTLDAV